MRVIIDAIGGDHAPDEILKGSCSDAGKYNAEITLAGNEGEFL